MKKPILFATAAVFAMTPALAQQTQQADETEQNQDAQVQSDVTAGADGEMDAVDFVTTAGMGDLFEIESARIAEGRAQSDDVRQFAERLIADHSQSAQDLVEAARETDVTVAVLGRLQMELGSADASGDGSGSETTSPATGTQGSTAGSADADATTGATGGASGADNMTTGTTGPIGSETAEGSGSSAAMQSGAGASESGTSGEASPSGAGAGTAASDTHVDAGRTAMLDPEHQQKIQALRDASDDEFDRRFLQIQIEAHEDAIEAFEQYAQSDEQNALQQHAEQTLPDLREHLERAQSLADDLG